jgi:hypothetical protein
MFRLPLWLSIPEQLLAFLHQAMRRDVHAFGEKANLSKSEFLSGDLTFFNSRKQIEFNPRLLGQSFPANVSQFSHLNHGLSEALREAFCVKHGHSSGLFI